MNRHANNAPHKLDRIVRFVPPVTDKSIGNKGCCILLSKDQTCDVATFLNNCATGCVQTMRHAKHILEIYQLISTYFIC